MHAPLGALEPSQTHVEHADPIPTVPNYFTRELECPWVSISVHHSYRHHPRTPCSVWYPNRKLPLAGNYNGGEAETSSQWASHFGAARGRKGGAAGWRWGRGLLWGGCDMWARLLKVTGAVKFRLQEGSGKCPAGSPNLSLDQDWISSRPQYGCDPQF